MARFKVKIPINSGYLLGRCEELFCRSTWDQMKAAANQFQDIMEGRPKFKAVNFTDRTLQAEGVIYQAEKIMRRLENIKNQAEKEKLVDKDTIFCPACGSALLWEKNNDDQRRNHETSL